jgi:hypothetical protein
MDYLKLIGYDCDDWNLTENPVIESECSSVYMKNLARKATQNIFQRYLAPIAKRFERRP